MSYRRAKYWDPDFVDPTGERHGGLSTWWWRGAPEGLATRRQLRALGLRPAGQEPAGQIMWRRYGRDQVAYLYRIDAAAVKRTASAAQLVALAKAMTARRTCGTCHRVRDYCIAGGECNDCQASREHRSPVVDPWTTPTGWREAA